MMKKNLAVAALFLTLGSSAFAICTPQFPGDTSCDPNPTITLQNVPLEEGGMLALAAGCLAFGIRIAQHKRK